MESLSGRVDLYYLLGILNSSMADQLLVDQRGGDYHIYPEHIRNLPIPIAPNEKQEEIGRLVKNILAKIEKGELAGKERQLVNELVQKLYEKQENKPCKHKIITKKVSDFDW